MDVYVRLFCVRAVLCVWVAACDGLIPRSRSPTDYVKDQKTEKAAGLTEALYILYIRLRSKC
jgi:hypothetical protein